MVRRVLGFGLLALLLLGAWQAAFASAPATDLARAGIDAAFARGLVVAGAPRVVLARSITAAELRARGFGDVGGDPDSTLGLAILEGDFALTHRAVPAPTGRDWRVSADYLALVFDDASAAPRLLATSRHGGRFRQLLNDPALPDDARP